jgi:hypothetical protein
LEPALKQLSRALLGCTGSYEALEELRVASYVACFRQREGVDRCFGCPHGFGGESSDALRKFVHEAIQLSVWQRTVDPSVAFGQIRVDIFRTEDDLASGSPA